MKQTKVAHSFYLNLMSHDLCWLHLMMAVRLDDLEVADHPGDVGHAVGLGELAGGYHGPEEVHHSVQVPGVLDVLGEHQGNTGDIVFFPNSFGFLNISAHLSHLYFSSEFLLTLLFCL